MSVELHLILIFLVLIIIFIDTFDVPTNKDNDEV